MNPLVRIAIELGLSLTAVGASVLAFWATFGSPADMYAASALYAGALAASVAAVALRRRRRQPSNGHKILAGFTVIGFFASLAIWIVFVHVPTGCERHVEVVQHMFDTSRREWYEGRDCTEEQLEREVTFIIPY